MDAHERSPLRSVALHAAVRDIVRSDPSRLEAARARVAEWLKNGSIHAAYAQAWSELLSKPNEQIFEALIERSEKMDALRQASPFAGVLDSRTRWRLLRQVADEAR